MTTSVRQLAVGGVLSLWLCLLAGLLGRWAWPLDLFANFRPQYFVLFVVLALALAFVNRKVVALVALAGAGVAAVPLTGYVTLGRPAEATPATFRLVTFNVWYRSRDLARMARYLESTHADVIVLQELVPARAMELHALLPTYRHVALSPTDIGAVILSKWPLVESRAVELSGSVSGNLVALDWQGTRVNLLGVHLHWPLGPTTSRSRNQELQSIATFVAGFGQPLLVAGDMNVTPWSPHFNRLLLDSKLSDTALGQGLAPSWPSRLRWIGIRIDHCLATSEWRSVSASTGPYVGSDHRPLVADLQLTGGG